MVELINILSFYEIEKKLKKIMKKKTKKTKNSVIINIKK